MAGMLYLVPTPIGNLGDISLRCRETLESADFIAAEDTRVTLKLLNHLGIKKSLVSYYEHNKATKGDRIVDRILAGETCALVSDAGSPAISDPGEDLVRQCAEAGITVCAIPGPCAAITALSISGQSTGRFCFEGFLSTAKKSRREHLDALRTESRTMIFYEAPNKLVSTLIKYTETPPKGEFVLIVAGAPETVKESASEGDAAARVAQLIAQGLSRKDAVRQTAAELGLPKNVVYDIALKDPE